MLVLDSAKNYYSSHLFNYIQFDVHLSKFHTFWGNDLCMRVCGYGVRFMFHTFPNNLVPRESLSSFCLKADKFSNIWYVENGRKRFIVPFKKLVSLVPATISYNINARHCLHRVYIKLLSRYKFE